jgi:hypothetical protein
VGGGHQPWWCGLADRVLISHDQPMVYLTGLAVHRASATYPGQGKTDARDAFVIGPGRSTGSRAQLLEIFPAREQALTWTNKGLLTLLSRYQTPAAIRRSGTKRIEGVAARPEEQERHGPCPGGRRGCTLQHTTLPSEQLAATMLARLAVTVLELDAEIAQLDARIEARFHQHPHAEVINSMPGTGTRLGAEFLAATGGDMSAFGAADRAAAFAGLAPVPRDSGRVSGNMRRPAATTVACCAPSTCPPWSACVPAPPHPPTVVGAIVGWGVSAVRVCRPGVPASVE